MRITLTRPLPVAAAQPDGEVVEEDERCCRGQQRPEERVAEVGAEDRVGRDPGRVVVGKAGQDSRADDGQQSERQSVLARPETSGTYSVPVARNAPGRSHTHTVCWRTEP